MNGAMTTRPALIVFTDLDGTLIDHDSYDWSPAIPALAALRARGAGLVLASSKTAPEIHALRRAVGFEDWPAIVENGAGLLEAHAAPDPAGEDYEKLRAILDTLPRHVRAPFQGFGDMDVQQVATRTGLTPQDAALAKQRAFSEPGTWHGSDDDKAAFLAALRDTGVQAQQGGRFLTLSFGATKADQVRRLAAKFRPPVTIALGDAPNDIEMLETCDFGVVIANPNAAPLAQLKGEDEGRITRSPQAGPQGWNRAILDLLARLDLE